MRTFISINLPEGIQKEIKKIQDKLPESKGRKTELGNLHLTLKFLGEIDEKKSEEIQKQLREIRFEKFETGIDSIGVFNENFIKIIWLHLKNCEELQKIVDWKMKEGGFEPEKRFMGHLTIFRVKKVKDRKKFLEEIKKIKIPKIKFEVKGFCLMKSEIYKDGPEYGVIEEYELK